MPKKRKRKTPVTKHSTGGCTAFAIHAMGIFNDDSIETVKLALDSEIDTVLEKFNADRKRKKQPPCHRDRAGIDGEEWHINVLQAALGKKGYFLKKVPVRNGGCTVLLLGTGKYFVDGHLNRSFLKIGKKRTIQMFQVSYYST